MSDLSCSFFCAHHSGVAELEIVARLCEIGPRWLSQLSPATANFRSLYSSRGNLVAMLSLVGTLQPGIGASHAVGALIRCFTLAWSAGWLICPDSGNDAASCRSCARSWSWCRFAICGQNWLHIDQAQAFWARLSALWSSDLLEQDLCHGCLQKDSDSSC